MKKKRILLLLFTFFLNAWAQEPDILKDMQIVEYWNRCLNDRLPVTYNHLLMGGYYNMPSARMGDEGEVGVGYSFVPPYRLYNLRVQLIDRLEISGNYRVFKGVDDPVLTPLGFGDFSDKGANAKISIFQPEDTYYQLPGIAIGWEDFIGTRTFKSFYVVATQVFLKDNFEFTLGWGKHRIRGLFGGLCWIPFRKMDCSYLNDLSFCAEYDATPYRSKKVEKHPDGHTQKTPFNVGLKYRLWNQFDFSLSYIRGCKWAFAASTNYNFGTTKGFLPKIDDALPYRAPVNIEPLGVRRSEEVMVQDILYAMRKEGLDLLEARLGYDDCGNKMLQLTVYNDKYRVERELRTHLNHLMAYLIPADIVKVIVIIEGEGFPVQAYHFHMPFVRLFGDKEMGPYELEILTPLCEAYSYPFYSRQLFYQRHSLFSYDLSPKLHSLFGSTKGKFKYCIGISLGLQGYIFDNLFYSLRFGQIFFSDMGHLSGIDRLNPSQLPNVHTDIMRYYRQKGFTIDEAFLQKNWNLGHGLYSRTAAGHFDQEYGGVASEFLYYPIRSSWAIGVEGAFLRKRKTTGICFSDRIRQLEGLTPHYHKWKGSQYFVDLYYEWKEARLDFKCMLGKFLADDWGGRFDLIRYFPSGLRLSFWYTLTNGHDKINGKTYYDKGISFSMPLDIFYTYGDRGRFGYGLSAWLRDVGYAAPTGYPLHQLIREQRNQE